MKAPIPADAIRKYGLVPGQSMQATIILLRTADALSVANVAIESDDGRSYVQVRDGEDQARYLVATKQPDLVLASAAVRGVPAAIVGAATTDRALTLGAAEPISLADLRRANEAWLPTYMAGEA